MSLLFFAGQGILYAVTASIDSIHMFAPVVYYDIIRFW